MNPQTWSRFTPPFSTRRRPITRRRFLRGSAVAMALPILESMASPFARASAAAAPRRMFCICNNLGVLPRPGTMGEKALLMLRGFGLRNS